VDVYAINATLPEREAERPDEAVVLRRARVEGRGALSGPRANWLGHRGPMLFAELAGFVALFYAIKLAITIRWIDSRALAVLWYVVLLAAVVPYVVLIASEEWKNWYAYGEAIWPGTMFRLLTVPTASFLWDIWSGPPRVLYLAIRTGVELLVLLPLWYWAFPAVGLGVYWG
jgi:hypothetical protein